MRTCLLQSKSSFRSMVVEGDEPQPASATPSSPTTLNVGSLLDLASHTSIHDFPLEKFPNQSLIRNQDRRQ